MLIYYNITMEQGSRSIFCTGEVRIHHDSALFQKAGATGLRTDLCPVSMSFILALEFPPEYLLPQTQACALTVNGTGDPLAGRRTPSQSHCLSPACALTRDQTCNLVS